MPEPSAEGPAIEVRRPSAGDALAIGDVYLRSWHAGYDGLVDPVRLEPVAAKRAAYDWPAAINDPDARFALGYVDGAAAGVAKIGPDPTEAVRGTWLELRYVATEFWGSGVAAELLRWATEHAAADGAAVMRLRVVEAQHRARRFYEREGWVYDPRGPADAQQILPAALHAPQPDLRRSDLPMNLTTPVVKQVGQTWSDVVRSSRGRRHR